MRRLLALWILLMGLSGCVPEYVTKAKTRAIEFATSAGASGREMRFIAAEWLEKEAKDKAFYEGTVEPGVETVYVMGCNSLAKMLRTQKEWWQVPLDFVFSLGGLFTGNEALKAVGA